MLDLYTLKGRISTSYYLELRDDQYRKGPPVLITTQCTVLLSRIWVQDQKDPDYTR